MRSRAIESQAIVVASAQVGKHNEKRTSYGNSMVIDCWGKVLARCEKDEEYMVFVEVDLDQVATTRKNMPTVTHQVDLSQIKIKEF